MFNIDAAQARTVRATAVSAFACWLFGQIADTTLLERLWSQAAILALGVGLLRVFLLESAKSKVS